ncbi:unnamed protein product [Thelazia callipaeda]|uniref:PHB domain-containing protein n=1 Tax=Thelazia callipaeda TaxID=103827 RepID=A0A0N5CYS2_THECL|nr:unnamed protein product [Thelazia callipaeda]
MREYFCKDSKDNSSLIDDNSDWQLKYRSIFTYAPYNDLDRMGYVAPKRYPTQIGPRYNRYLYSLAGREITKIEPPTIHTEIVEIIFVALSILLFLMTLPLSLIFSIKFVGDFERLVVLRLGRAQKARGPGATVILPCIDTCTKVDLRVNAFNVPPMQVITIDRGLVELGATVLLQVKDALASVCAIQEHNQSIRISSIATLRRLVCKRHVSDITSSMGRKQLCENLQLELGVLTVAWGIEIIKVELSEVKVIKEGENMALSIFSKVLKSEVGSQIMETLTGAAQDFVTLSNVEKQERDQYLKQQTDRCQETAKHLKIDLSGLSEKDSHEEKNSGYSLNDCLDTLDIDIDHLLCSLTMVIDEQLVTSVGHIFQVYCTEFGEFYIDLKNGAGQCCNGVNPKADVTFYLDRELLFKIIRGKVTPIQAYTNGSIRIVGAVKAALKLTLLSDRFNCLL